MKEIDPSIQSSLSSSHSNILADGKSNKDYQLNELSKGKRGF